MLMKPQTSFLRVIALLLIVAIVCSTANVNMPLHAQTIISVAIPAAEKDLLNENLIQAFQADHPNVQVNVVLADTVIPPAIKGLDQHLTQIERYVTSAD